MKFCLALCIAAVIVNVVISQDECYEICGFEGRNTKDVGECLQRPIKDGGQADSVQESMLEIYNNVEISGIKPGGVEDGDALLIGLNAAKSGESTINSEGLYYCVADSSGADAFYWVLNCGVVKQGLSGDELLCVSLTLEE